MKKLLIIFGFALLISMNSIGQIQFEVNELTIWSIIDSDSNEFEQYSGPMLRFHCSIINSCNELIIVYPLKDTIWLTFYIKEELFRTQQISLNLAKHDSIQVFPSDTIRFSIMSELLLGTGYCTSTEYDYTWLLLELLPTLRLYYSGKYVPFIEFSRMTTVKIIKPKWNTAIN